MIPSIAQTRETLSTLDFATLLVIARQRRYITVAVFSWIIILLLLFSFLLPQVSQIVTNLQTIKDQETEYQDLSAKVAYLRDSNDSEIDTQLGILGAALPSVKPVLPLLASLERIAADAQVSVGNLEINPGEVASKSGQLRSVGSVQTKFPQVYALPLHFQLAGTFPNMSIFFKRLDELVPLVQVTTIHFSAEAKDTKTASASANFHADVELASLYTIPDSTTASTGVFNPVPFTQADQNLLTTLSNAASTVRQDAQNTPVSTGSARKSIFAQ